MRAWVLEQTGIGTSAVVIDAEERSALDHGRVAPSVSHPDVMLGPWLSVKHAIER